MYELLIFDADHTLFDFDKAEENAIRMVLSEARCTYSDDKLRLYKDINMILWKKYELQQVTQQQIKTERFRIFFDQIGCNYSFEKGADDYLVYLSMGTDLLPGAEALIFNLQKEYKLGLLTNGISKVQHPRLENSVLKDSFDAFVVSGDVGISKPDPRLYEKLAEEAGFKDKSKMLMIGDSLTSDMQGGNNFDIDTCWFNPEEKPNNTEARPTYVIRNLEELYEILGKERG